MTPPPRRERLLRFGALSLIMLGFLALLATPATAPGDAAQLRLAAAPVPEPGPVTISTVPPSPTSL